MDAVCVALVQQSTDIASGLCNSNICKEQRFTQKKLRILEVSATDLYNQLRQWSGLVRTGPINSLMNKTKNKYCDM